MTNYHDKPTDNGASHETLRTVISFDNGMPCAEVSHA